MADYYVDPAAAGSNNGSDWTNAWTSLQTALDTVTVGNTIYCRGTQTLTATIDVDTNAGGNATGYIKVIGCNASGVVDGTRFVLDANGGSYHVMTVAESIHMLWLENIEFKNTAAGSYDGLSTSSTTESSGWVLLNCCANTCGRYGYYLRYIQLGLLFRCVAYSNGSDGIYASYSSMKLVLCLGRDNTGRGFFVSKNCIAIGCISHNNTDDGMNVSYGGTLLNCVIDGNTNDGVVISSGTSNTPHILLWDRITNHSGSGNIGLNCNSEPVVSGWNYFENNDGNNIQNATLHYEIPLEGGSTSSNVEDQSNTDKGYVDSANHNFATDYASASDPSLRRTAITIPWS